MKPLTVYGIKNCDTMKKAFAWLDSHKVPYVFHDYKKDGADAGILERAVTELGWENVLNRKGTTWRGLPEKTRDTMNSGAAIRAALDNPSLIKRPLIAQGKKIHLGFDAQAFEKAFLT